MDKFETVHVTLMALREESDSLTAHIQNLTAALDETQAAIKGLEGLLRRRGMADDVEDDPPAKVSGRIENAVKEFLRHHPRQKVVDIARGLMERGYGSNEKSMQNMVSRVVLNDGDSFTRDEDRRWSLVSASAPEQRHEPDPAFGLQ